MRDLLRIIENADRAGDVDVSKFDINDVTIQHDGRGAFDALWNGEKIGDLVVASTGGDFDYHVSGVEVLPPFRRRGVATLLYDAAEAWLDGRGDNLVPSSADELSDDAFHFWYRRAPWGDIRFDPRWTKPSRQ